MLWGYNTNGLAHHDPLDAVDLLASLGYGSIALTIDHTLLSPRSGDLPAEVHRIKKRLARHNMRSVIETGARFLLDPRQKHEPTLVSPDASRRAVRIAFLRHAIDMAAELGSDCVSLWGGVVHDGAAQELVTERLVAGLSEVLAYADQRGVTIGFEPEPGMAIDTMQSYDLLRDQLAHPRFQLTLDIGHLHCLGETPLADYIRRYADVLVNVHLEDMQAGVHEHLMFGEGEIDFLPVLQALRDIRYSNGIHVELSRHSHQGPTAAVRSIEFLRHAASK